MLILWTYYDKLRDPNNDEIVLDILTQIFECDFFTEGIVRRNIQVIKKLYDIGEEEIYNEVINLMKQHPIYSSQLNAVAIQ